MKKSANFEGFPRLMRRRSELVRLSGGGRGIRTPGGVSPTAVFKTAGFNRSPIPPQASVAWLAIQNAATAESRAVGSGIPLMPDKLAQYVGVAGCLYLVWVAGGLLSPAGALRPPPRPFLRCDRRLRPVGFQTKMCY